MRAASRLFLIACIVAISSHSLAAQEVRPVNPDTLRMSVGGSLLGFSPKGAFAENVDFAGGIGGHFLIKLDPQGVVALRADASYLIYGHERYRTPLGAGPLGLIQVDVSTTNSIIGGGLGLQMLSPGRTVRPYANGSVGFSFFSTSSSVEGSDNSEQFASSTNYEDGGFAWTAGGGLYVPLAVRKVLVTLDLAVRYIDNGNRDYLREDGITFVNNQVQLNPVSSEAKGVQYMLGVTVSFR